MGKVIENMLRGYWYLIKNEFILFLVCLGLNKSVENSIVGLKMRKKFCEIGDILIYI